jgi:hypothetical protein
MDNETTECVGRGSPDDRVKDHLSSGPARSTGCRGAQWPEGKAPARETIQSRGDEQHARSCAIRFVLRRPGSGKVRDRPVLESSTLPTLTGYFRSAQSIERDSRLGGDVFEDLGQQPARICNPAKLLCLLELAKGPVHGSGAETFRTLRPPQSVVGVPGCRDDAVHER